MPADDPHRVKEGQGIRIAAGLAAGIVHQPSQGKVGKQEAIELLLGKIHPTAAQHQPLAGQAHLQLGEGALALPALVIKGGQLGSRCRVGLEQGGDQPISGSAPGRSSSR